MTPTLNNLLTLAATASCAQSTHRDAVVAKAFELCLALPADYPECGPNPFFGCCGAALTPAPTPETPAEETPAKPAVEKVTPAKATKAAPAKAQTLAEKSAPAAAPTAAAAETPSEEEVHALYTKKVKQIKDFHGASVAADPADKSVPNELNRLREVHGVTGTLNELLAAKAYAFIDGFMEYMANASSADTAVQDI